MNGLLFLSSDDFYINETPNGKLLLTHMNQGLFLVLFYSTQCEHCKKAIPVFKELPRMIHGCTFGMINVSTNAKVVHMSRNTVSPVQFVPYIVLYLGGEPYYMYKGAITPTELQKFIIEMSKLLQTRQQFIKKGDNPGVPNKQEKKIPEFCSGVPYCDEDVCYLEFDTAYSENTVKGQT